MCIDFVIYSFYSTWLLINETLMKDPHAQSVWNIWKENITVLPRHEDGSDGKASTRHAGDPSSIPGLRRSPGEGNGNPLQYCCLENSMDGGAWWATVHRVAKSRTRLSDLTFYFKSYQRDIRITVTNTARKHYRHLKKSSKNNFQHGIA